MALTRIGPARVPSRESPETAIELLQERGYTACEIDFEGKFWMDYPWAERFGELAREADIALSVHAPIAGFMGHLERDKKYNMATGMLDHSAGVAVACGAELVVFHPGFFLGREREAALTSVAEQLGSLRERLEGKDRAVPFGIEVMGRVRDLGSLEDVIWIAERVDVGAPGDRLRPHACDLRRRVHRGRRLRRRARARRRGARAGRPFPHPLLRHRVRQPERDEAPPLRRGNAPRRPARRRRWRASSARRQSSRSRRTRSRRQAIRAILLGTAF